MFEHVQLVAAAPRARLRGWLAAAVAAVVVVPFVGCASEQSSQRFSDGLSVDNASYDETVAFDQSRTYDQTGGMQEYFTEAAEQYNLPPEYLSEARIGMTEIEKQLAVARAAELQRDADFRSHSAQVETMRAEAAADEESALAEVDRLRGFQIADQAEIAATLAARERQAEARIERNARLAEALAKEQRTAQQDLLSRAEQLFEEEKAHIDELRVIRLATEKEGGSALDHMRKNLQSTRQRAAATVVSLRQEARSSSEKTSARLAELGTRLATIPKQVQAKASRLRAHSTAVEDESRARADELAARAGAIERGKAEHRYNLMISVAKTNRKQAKAQADRKGAEARANYERATTDVERRRSDAHMTIQGAQSESTKDLGELTAWFKRSKADVSLIRSRADRMEKVARSEFVKALVRGATAAVRETGRHQDTLSAAQMKTTIAEAEAKAAKVRDHLWSELARQTRNGGVALPGKTSVTNKPMNIDDVPAVAKVAAVAPYVAPEDVAAFRASLAKVLHERIKADTDLSTLEADYNERKAIIDAVRNQRSAVGNEQLASADAMHLKAVAGLGERNSALAAEQGMARSSYDRAVVEAETFRRNALSEGSELRAQAKAVLDIGLARSDALRKEAQVVTTNGQSEVDALQVELRAAEERGEAETNRLMTEANSVEQSQSALAQQLASQIESAERYLEAELLDLDRKVESRVVIAEADYNEAMVQAEAIGSQTEMEIRRLEARNDLEQAIARAEIERMHDVHFINTIKGEAQIERRLATTMAERILSDASSDARQAGIRARADIMSATADAKRRIASARSNVVRSRFETRVIEVDSDRIKRRADALVKAAHERANAETILAEAEAARSETMKRLERLAKHQDSLQRAAVKDWDARLAKNPVRGFDR